ncbi:hypothetical protein MACK_002981 [Theileria orientalis]|uniref:SART-1 family protein n=1 Tax=Theileria orientalis TaxID=68886 RepID=A0A976MFB4_THEOR|nr:hypothetical protein MACK_002981 [Theileria orientalis]
MPTDDDSITSFSIDETNELRKKLGLKPLITSSTETNKEPEKTGQDTEEVIERLNEVRRRRARESLIKGGSIADSIKKGESISHKRKKFGDETDDVDTLDLLTWSKKMGSVSKTTITQAENEVTYSDEEEEITKNSDGDHRSSLKSKEHKDKPDTSKIKVLHKMNELDLVKGDEVTLTLKDVGVLEAEAAGISDLDFLENVELVDMKNDKKKMQQKLRNQYGNYVPYEEDDGLNTGFLKHYDDKIKETQGLKLTSLANEDDGFFIKINEPETVERELDEQNKTYETMSKRTMKNELVDETDIFSSLSQKKNKLKKKPKQMNWDKIFTKDDTAEFDLSNIVPTKIKKDIAAVEDDDDDQLYNKISNHRRRVEVKKVKSEDTTDVKPHVDFDKINEGKGIEITATTEFINVVKTPMEKIIEQESEPKYNINTSDQEVKDDDPNTLAEVPLGDGISAALSYIKQRGDFIEKKAEARSKEVQLNYLDSYGNEMTPKEAFRQISWIFHGKKPSMNKIERKVRRMERERVARQNPVEGLPTMKALFSHQEKEETTHLVLTGNRNNN